MNEHTLGGFLTSRGYRAAKARPASNRAVRDHLLIGELVRIHADNYSVYGVRKMWHAMARAGWSIGREQVRRLMRCAGLAGVRRGRKPTTTTPGKAPDTRADLVNRNFTADRPGALWVADITYVRTNSGFVYTAFVTDAFSRKIVGWSTASTLTTEALPMEALDQALATAYKSHNLVHHCDHGSQYTSVAYSERLNQAKIAQSTGSVGDSYDNALAESVNGLYKSELIYSQRWKGLAEVEYATLTWVNWWNNHRLHETLDYHTPQEVENHHYETRATTGAHT